MSRPTNSQALKEAYAQAKSGVIVYNTLQLGGNADGTSGGGGGGGIETVEIAFVVDDTGSMSSFLTTVKAIVTDLVDDLQAEYVTVRFSLARFKDEDDTTIELGLTEDGDAFIAAINELSASGGGDGPENGFGATVMVCDNLSWAPSNSTTQKLVYLFTDQTSHERGATEAQALSALESEDAIFLLSTDDGDAKNYGGLVSSTGGSIIDYNQPIEDVLEDILNAIGDAAPPAPPDTNFYVIQAVEQFELPLEVSGTPKVFEPVGFSMALPGQNDQGIQDIGIAIDNVDGRVLEAIQRFAATGEPVPVYYRPYLSTDLSQPQLSTPYVFTLSDVRVTDNQVSGRASFADIVNLKFLNVERYSAKRFPSLNNT